MLTKINPKFSLMFFSRFVTQLLQEVIYFVAMKENDPKKPDPLDLVVSHPNRERQKLLREQNILKQVMFFFLFSPFLGKHVHDILSCIVEI